MRLVCERCKASYSIADEKVRGKIVTLHCQHCNHLIQARGPSASSEADTVDRTGRRGASAAGARAAGGRSSVLDRPLRVTDRAGLKPTADQTRPARGAAGRLGAGVGPDPGTRRREPLDEPAFSRARVGAGDPARGDAPPQSPAVSRFASDRAGRLRRDPAPGGRDVERSPDGARDAAGSFDGDDRGPKTTIASFDDIAASLGASPEPPDEWYLSVDGEQRGPFTKEVLEEEIPRFADQEHYVWHEGFEDWLPPSEVEELDPSLRLSPPPPAGVVRGSKVPAAERAEALRQSPWSAAGSPDGEAEEAPWKGQSKAEPLPPPPDGEDSGAVPRRLDAAQESSGAKVVSIEAARERAAARPQRDGRGSHGGSSATRPLPAGDAGDGARGARGAEAKPAARRTDRSGSESGAVAASRTGAAAGPATAAEPLAPPETDTPTPSPAPAEPPSLDDLVVSEPSQVVRVTRLSGAGALAGEAGVHGPSDETAVASGVVLPARHKTNRVLLIAAVGGALATLSLAGVVVYLVGRGPRVQVREVVRLKSPEELGVEADTAVARLLAEKRFAAGTPAAAGAPPAAVSPVGASETNAGRTAAAPSAAREPAARRPAARPGTSGAAPPAKRGGAVAGMSGFFKSTPGGTKVGAPNLSGAPELHRPAARRVSDEEIVRAINRQRGTLNVCYNRALKYDNSLKSVRLDVTVKIGLSGRATSVSIHQAAFRSSFLGGCLVDAIKRWTFPSGGSEYTTVMPLVLQGQ
jgi:predicted Zn finger-like uncharacterized protein